MKAPVGVILAGGRGRRMGPLGEDYAKALLPVANEPIIGHHLRLLHDLGVHTVYIVVGHRGCDLMQALGEGERYNLQLRYINQHAPLGSAHALGLVRPYIDGPFFVTLGDYYCHLTEPVRMLQRLWAGSSAIASVHEPNRRLMSEACLVTIDTNGRVQQIVEKPVSPAGDLKGCGFYALQPQVFDAVARTPRTALRDEYELTLALELYVATGHALYAEKIILWDRNFTRPEDVLTCNLHWLAMAGLNELIGEEVDISEAAVLERAVVGSRARLRDIKSLSDVVIFPDVQYTGTGVIRQALVTQRGLHPVDEPAATSTG